MNTPYVSVIIPTYNRAYCIEFAINSVLAQTLKDFELIVVDDGSTDNTPDVLARFGDRIRVIRQQNAGVSAALNAGIFAARGGWVAILGSDDEWLPDALEKLFTPFADDDKIIARVGNVQFEDDRLEGTLFQLRGWAINQPKKLRRPLIRAIRTWFFPQAFVARRQEALAVGLFDTRLSLHEDSDFMLRLALAGPWMVTPAVVAKIVRRSRGDDLSAAHVVEPENTPRNLVYIYRRLLLSERIDRQEIAYVRRQLSGAWHDWAYARYRSNSQPWRSLLLKAILDGRSWRALMRSAPPLFLGAVGFQLANFLRRLKTPEPHGFRRSEIRRR